MPRLARTLALTLAIGFVAPAAHAGFYMEHEAELPNPMTMKPEKHTVRSWHQGRKFKRENPMRNETVIIDLDTKIVTGVNDEKKTYWQTTSDRYKSLALMSLIVMGVQFNQFGGFVVPDGLLQPTGEVKRVAGNQAYEVRVNGKLPPGMKTSFWLSTDVQVPMEKMIDELRLSLGDPKDPQLTKLFAQWRALDGYPVQTETVIQTPRGAITTRETLVKYKKQRIGADVFAVPKGYTKTSDPITQLEQLARQMQQQGGGGGMPGMGGGMPGMGGGMPNLQLRPPMEGGKKQVLPRKSP